LWTSNQEYQDEASFTFIHTLSWFEGIRNLAHIESCE